MNFDSRPPGFQNPCAKYPFVVQGRSKRSKELPDRGKTVQPFFRQSLNGSQLPTSGVMKPANDAVSRLSETRWRGARKERRAPWLVAGQAPKSAGEFRRDADPRLNCAAKNLPTKANLSKRTLRRPIRERLERRWRAAAVMEKAVPLLMVGRSWPASQEPPRSRKQTVSTACVNSGAIDDQLPLATHRS